MTLGLNGCWSSPGLFISEVGHIVVCEEFKLSFCHVQMSRLKMRVHSDASVCWITSEYLSKCLCSYNVECKSSIGRWSNCIDVRNQNKSSLISVLKFIVSVWGYSNSVMLYLIRCCRIIKKWSQWVADREGAEFKVEEKVIDITAALTTTNTLSWGIRISIRREKVRLLHL